MANQELTATAAQVRTYAFGGLTVLTEFTGRSLNELRWTTFEVEPHVVDTKRTPISLRSVLVAQITSNIQADTTITPTLLTPDAVNLTAGGATAPTMRFRASAMTGIPPWIDSMGSTGTIVNHSGYAWPVKTSIAWSLAPGVNVNRLAARFYRTNAVQLANDLAAGSSTVVFIFTPSAMDGNTGRLLTSGTNYCSHLTTTLLVRRITTGSVNREFTVAANPREFSPVLVAVTFSTTGTTMTTIDRYGLTVAPVSSETFAPFDVNNGTIGVDAAFDLFEVLIYATPITSAHVQVLMQLAAAYGVN